MEIQDKNLLIFLDNFFLYFHALFSLFNCLAWIWQKTRLLHLISVSLTGLSWFVLGIWYGWGYCFCTDWHWQVRDALNRPVNSYSYIHFLIRELTGLDLNPSMVDMATLMVFFAVSILSAALNYKDFRNRRKPKNNVPSH